MPATMPPEEAAFVAALDADPSDHTTRLVYADWLDEQPRPRCEDCDGSGRHMSVYYLADRMCRMATDRPCEACGGRGIVAPARVELAAWYRMMGRRSWCPEDTIPRSLWWWADLPPDWDAEIHPDHPGGPTMWTTVRQAEDAAALAFARLPPARQAELLAW